MATNLQPESLEQWDILHIVFRNANTSGEEKKNKAKYNKTK